MNMSALKLGALILKLENLIETCPAFKVGDQAALMQMSLVKEQHFVLNEQIQRMKTAIDTKTLSGLSSAFDFQDIRDDLDK